MRDVGGDGCAGAGSFGADSMIKTGRRIGTQIFESQPKQPVAELRHVDLIQLNTWQTKNPL